MTNNLYDIESSNQCLKVSDAKQRFVPNLNDKNRHLCNNINTTLKEVLLQTITQKCQLSPKAAKNRFLYLLLVVCSETDSSRQFDSNSLMIPYILR